MLTQIDLKQFPSKTVSRTEREAIVRKHTEKFVKPYAQRVKTLVSIKPGTLE